MLILKREGNDNNNNNYTWVLVARGGRERSNPATRKTHSGMGVKETHYINVVGKNTNTHFKGPRVVVYLKLGLGELNILQFIF